jgi:hypothetical protein
MKTEVAFLVLLGVATWVSAANLSKKSQEALSNIFRTTFAWDIDVTVSDSDKVILLSNTDICFGIIILVYISLA